MKKKTKFFLVFLFLLYLILIFYSVLFDPVRFNYKGIFPHHFIPFESTFTALFYPQYNDAQHYIAFIENLFGNILLLLPFTFFIRIMFAKKTFSNRKILALAFVFSFLIELSQLIFNLGVFDVDDIMLNTLGAWFGIILAERFLQSFQKRS